MTVAFLTVAVKVCGLRRAADAERAVEAGARLLGCVLAADSPRRATHDEVRRVAAAGAAAEVPVETVLVFRAASTEQVVGSCRALGLRRVQVHRPAAGQLVALARAGLLVHRVHGLPAAGDGPGAALPRLEPAPTPHCPALLDTGAGGSGTPFDWDLLAGGAPHATYVAGGLTPENLPALLVHRPFGVDLSSGLESAPGVKDPGRLRDLFALLETAS